MEHLINNQIKEREVLLIKFDGDSGGIVSTVDALQMAQDEGMDLIEVSKSKNGKPAVCKISNYGKLKYKESKRKNAAKEKNKEIIFGFNIGEHDLQTKNKQVLKFLQKNYKVKYVLELRGRQRDMIKEGLKKVSDNLKLFVDVAKMSDTKVEKSRGRNKIVTTIQSNLK